MLLLTAVNENGWEIEACEPRGPPPWRLLIAGLTVAALRVDLEAEDWAGCRSLSTTVAPGGTMAGRAGLGRVLSIPETWGANSPFRRPDMRTLHPGDWMRG